MQWAQPARNLQCEDDKVEDFLAGGKVFFRGLSLIAHSIGRGIELEVAKTRDR